jgi:hypothetical protein
MGACCLDDGLCGEPATRARCENAGGRYQGDGSVCADDLCAVGGDDEQQVTICHIPPGNPDNAHTITVGASAVPAHLAHGDTLGPCPEG